ncbi:CCA tRNA nucleotidyltransferase [Roseitranquillus sediminis]|uniref:CCA tRNA nucleotidyltransferase n=1 Tax=Roseitranquillus sediminis TaxID=2809051 RepID=UPI001D0C45F7|nr:CCA tRNA nucleotidyltransferase [Roseitranquillus sediminis]MBM9593816.1 CCA tRNA nucleotidyltransferase [Roseitranquillus sediminis]
MRINGDWLRRAETQAVLRLLRDAGYQALVVGGCVRNALLEQPVSDIDVATDARPEAVVALAEAAGIKAVPTGIEHGTVTLVLAGRPYEVTTLRRDVETDGRRAVVAFTDDVAEDARRRDLTMNALYADAEGTLVDPLGGFADVRAGRVRFVGDAARRIAEDRLRILRFFRFHAWYGDPAEGLDAEGLAACAAAADGMAALSRERVGAEMTKLLTAPDPAPSVAAMASSGVLSHVLPGADAAPLVVLVAAEQAAGAEPDAVRRLAVLGGEDVPARLRLPRKAARRLELLRREIGGTAGTAELAWRHGAEVARDTELLRSAVFGAPLPATLQDDIEAGTAARFPVAAADLTQTGPDLGRALAVLERRWIDSGFALNREELLRSGTG